MAEQAPTHNDGISDFVENTRGVLTATRPDGSTLQMIPAELDQRAGSNAPPRTGYHRLSTAGRSSTRLNRIPHRM